MDRRGWARRSWGRCVERGWCDYGWIRLDVLTGVERMQACVNVQLPEVLGGADGEALYIGRCAYGRGSVGHY